MKTKGVLWRIPALVLVFGFLAASCDSSTSTEGILIVSSRSLGTNVSITGQVYSWDFLKEEPGPAIAGDYIFPLPGGLEPISIDNGQLTLTLKTPSPDDPEYWRKASDLSEATVSNPDANMFIIGPGFRYEDDEDHFLAFGKFARPVFTVVVYWYTDSDLNIAINKEGSSLYVALKTGWNVIVDFLDMDARTETVRNFSFDDAKWILDGPK